MRKKTQKELQAIWTSYQKFSRYSVHMDQRFCDYGNFHDPLEKCTCKDEPEEPGYPALDPMNYEI